MLSEVPAQCRMRCVAFLRTTNCSEPRHGRHGKALAHAATSARRSGTARTREAVVSSKMFESLVSRCLVVERLKVQSTQPIAAVAKRGRNCTRLAARFGHKLSRELLEQLLHVRQRLCCRETSRLLWRAVCRGSGDRRKLVHEDGLRRGVRIHKKERTQTRWTPRAAPLLRCG